MRMDVYVDVSRPFEIETATPAETAAIGAELVSIVDAGAVIALQGDLGAGKTEFVKGFADGAGSRDVVSSPTFAILNTYVGRRWPVFHFDLYRIANDSELAELGFDEYLFGEGVCLIEWPERASGWLPSEAVRLRFEHVDGARRRITREA
jgi:tRNA threonylcarbamoyladenosine biosynthesis protein TsaE